jgi:superfamily II DNA or RNA helicase
MSEDSILDFLPKYPDITSENFYEDIFKKYEFNEKRLNINEEVKSIDWCSRLDNEEQLRENIPENLYMNHQIIIARFLSMNTQYQSMLLVHQMGTGKTKAAIAVAENIHKDKNSTIRKTIVCAKNHGLLENFRNELVCRTNGEYIPENYALLSSESKRKRTNRLLRRFYDFSINIHGAISFGYTFYELAKEVSNLSDNFIIEKFSNKLFIFDEIHNIRDKPEKKQLESQPSIDIYKQIWKLLHTAKNTKILLMTGTPIKDSIVEISYVLNLILPLNAQFPSGRKFLKQFFDKSQQYYYMKPEMIPIFKEALKGRVSYLKAITSTIPKIFIGDKNYGGLEYFIVEPDIMGKFQSQVYEKAFHNDTNAEGVIYLDSREASLFVFPDGTYGSKGFTKYVTQKRDKIFRKKKSALFFSLHTDLNKPINDAKTIDEKLAVINKWSSKYAICIKNILESQRNGQSQFVYCEYVKGSGAILFSLLLEKFGFSRAFGNETSKALRYAIFTTETTNARQINEILERFNRKDNMNGEYINVIIGSGIISEGFSFKNIQNMHILTMYWNYSETEQVIYRGYRYGSHRDLLENGYTPEYRIYQYVSIPLSKNPEESVDMLMAKISEVKDVNTKRIEMFIKEAAFDCALNYKRNHITGYDNQRDCNYQSCEYNCDGINQLRPVVIDYSTYDLYYDQNSEKSLEYQIALLFHDKSGMNIYQIFEHFPISTEYQILNALNFLISNNIPIKNKYIEQTFLREMRDYYYLVLDISIEPTYMDEFYTSNITAQEQDISYKEALMDIEFEFLLPAIVTKIFDSNETEIPIIIKSLPSFLKAIILELALKAEIQNIDVNRNKRKIIIDTLQDYYSLIDNIYVITMDSIPYICFNATTMQIVQCSEDIIRKYNTQKQEQRTEISTQYNGYYGLYNPDNNKFCIYRPQEGQKKKGSQLQTGIVCGTGLWNKKNLINVIVKIFRIPSPMKPRFEKEVYKNKIISDRYIQDLYSNEELSMMSIEELNNIYHWTTLSAKDLCIYLRKWLDDQKLLIANTNCGTQFKKRLEEKAILAIE